MPVVDIEGIGTVEFPEDSTDDEILEFANREARRQEPVQSPPLRPAPIQQVDSLSPSFAPSQEVIGLSPTTPRNFLPSGPVLRAPDAPSIHGTVLDVAESVGRSISPILGPTETQRLEAGPEGFRPLGSTLEREGLVPGMFTPSEQSPWKLPHAGPKESTGGQLLAGSYNALADAANVMTSSPGGVLTAGVGAALSQAKGALRVLSGAFAVDMGRQLPEQLAETLRTLDDPNATLQEKSQAVTGFITSSAFTALTAKHGFSPTKPGAVAPSRLQPAADVARQPQPSSQLLLIPEVAAAIKDSGVNVRVGQTKPGAKAQFDPETGDVVLSEDFDLSLAEVAPENRQQWVRSVIGQEVNHREFRRVTSEAERSQFWENMTAAEKALHLRSYVGQWTWEGAKARYKELTGRELSPELMGYEAADAMLSRLQGMTPEQVLETVGREKWTLKTVNTMADMVYKLRRTVGTKASAEQSAILDRASANLEIARTRLQQQQERGDADETSPEGYRILGQGRFESETAPPTDAINVASTTVGGKTKWTFRLPPKEVAGTADEPFALFRQPQEKKQVIVESPDGKRYRATFDGIQDFTVIGKGKVKQITTIDEIPGVSPDGGTTYDFSLQEKGFKIIEPDAEPAALRRRKPGKDEPELTLPPMKPGEERGPVELDRVTPNKMIEAATEYLQSETPTFNDFVDTAKRRFGDIQSGQLRDVWEDAVWERVMSATGKELEGLRAQLKLRKLGTREVKDAPPKEEGTGLELKGELSQEAKAAVRQEDRATRSQQNYRTTVARAVGQKLIEQSYGKESLRKALNRTSLTIDDLADYKPDFYREISAEEIANPEVLKKIITKDYRATQQGKTIPESMTRRVVALVDKATGEVHLVSVYNQGGKVPTIFPPNTPRVIREGDRPGKPLAPLLKKYRPISTALLDEPVQNFEQKFRSVDDFNSIFGDDAKKALEAQAAYEATLEEGAGDLSEGPSRFEHLMSGSEITPQEAGAIYKSLFETVEPTSPDHVANAIDKLAADVRNEREWSSLSDAQKQETPKPAKPNWAAITGFQKAFDAMRQANPDATLKELYADIYQKVAASEGTKQFQQAASTSYGRGSPRDVRGIPETAEAPSATGRELRALDRPPIKPWPGTHQQGPSVPFPFEKGGARPEAEPAALNRRNREKARALKAILKDPAGSFSRMYGQWLTSVVRENGKDAAARAADTFDAIIDRAKKVYGDQVDVLNPAKERAGGSARIPVIGEIPNPKLIAQNAELTKLTHPVSKDYGVANIQEYLEGRLATPPKLQATVDAINDANIEAGRVVVPVTPGFTPSGKLQRNLTGLGHDILTEGESHPNWKGWTAALAIDPVNFRQLKRNTAKSKVPVQSRADAVRWMRSFFRKWGNTLKDPAADPNRIEKINQDFKRHIPRAVTHVRTPLGYQEVIHTNPVNYLEMVAQRAAFTRAFREQFPDTPAGRTDFAQLNDAVRSELKSHIVPYWDALVRTAQGRPADSYVNWGWLRPGTVLGEAAKGFNQTAMATLARLALTTQSVLGAPETLGTGIAELGMKNKLRAAARLKQLWHEMEKTGQVNAMIYDWSYDPASPIRSSFRMFNNVVAKGFAENLQNELQGRWNAAMAIVAADRIRNQKTEPLTAWEKRQYPETFRKMQFTKDQVADLMAGNGALLKAFERRFPSWMSGENAPMAERSMAAQKRWLSSIFKFQQYPMTVFNQFSRNLKRVGEAFREKEGRAAAIEGMSRFLFSKGAQGVGYVALGSLLSGGLPGLKIKFEEAKDEPMDFMLEALLASLSGPYYVLWQAMRRQGGLAGAGETLSRTMFPFSQATDLWDMVQSNGQYRDQDLPARIGKYFMQKVPAARAMKQGLAAAGLAEANPELEAAMKGLYRWKREAMGWDESRTFRENDERAAFRTEMRAAVDALKKGNMEEYAERLQGALVEAIRLGGEGEPEQRIVSSLRKRKALQNLDGGELTLDELDALTSRIGEAAVERLQQYDATLEGLAESFAPRKRRR